jgi:hypothetical protein
MMQKLAATSFLALAAADYSSIQQQIMAMVRNSSLRAFAGNVQAAVESFDEYGCWCYFYDNVGRGKGTPVDELDGMCKTLHDGYTCAIIDAELEGADECIPWEVEYNPGSGAGNDRFATCQAANPGGDNCAVRACSVEGIFTDNVFALLLGGSQADLENFSHSQGFDPATDAGCPVKPGVHGSSGAKECCGSYPNRFPFKTLDGDRACCASRTYNTQILSCCPNGQVKANC